MKVFTGLPLRRSRYPNLLRSEEHTSELQSRFDLVCRLLLEKKKKKNNRKIRAQKQKIVSDVLLNKEIIYSRDDEEKYSNSTANEDATKKIGSITTREMREVM